MNDSIDSVTRALKNSGFLSAMEKTRQAFEQSLKTMSSVGENIRGLGADAGARAQKDRLAAAPGESVSEEKKKHAARPATGMASLDHFGTSNMDRFARLGLFLGGAPQTPGLSEARRTAKAVEESCKLIKQVLLKTGHGSIEHAVYAE